ncbi:MAG: hypothetical protein K0S71_1033 [Clostridia bacterium]|jgi:hypothetical protein|nr:hypothetical protein [Clostridia bacterium]
MHGTISCSVDSCSYNQEGVCNASILNIGGSGAQITEATSCETYLKQSEYSNLAQTVRRGHTDTIFCSVDTCAYHDKQHCTLKEIEVGCLKDVDDYTETDCLSFERE